MSVLKSETLLQLWNNLNAAEYHLKKAYTIPVGQSKSSQNFTEAPINFPLGLILHSEVWFLAEIVAKPTEPTEVCIKVTENTRKSLIPHVEVKNKKHELFNDLIDLSEVKAPRPQLESFRNVVDKTADCLWVIDCNHDKFALVAANGHCKTLQPYFSSI